MDIAVKKRIKGALSETFNTLAFKNGLKAGLWGWIATGNAGIACLWLMLNPVFSLMYFPLAAAQGVLAHLLVPPNNKSKELNP
jgi:hypothetical protein